MSTRSARRPLPALVFLIALAVLAVIVWVRVTERDTTAEARTEDCVSAPQLPANNAVTVSVLNGSDVTGLAQQVVLAYGAMGFTVGGVDNAPQPLASIATITYGPNGAGAALLVGSYLPGAAYATDSREDLSVTITVGAQYTKLNTPAQASQALAKASLSQTPAAPSSGASGSPSAAPSSPSVCLTTPPVPTPGASGQPG